VLRKGLDDFAKAIYNGLMSSKCYPAVKVGTYKVRSSGRGFVSTIPEDWAKDVGLTKDDSLIISRDTKDRLILEPAKRKAS
jgi:hypothetical protein